MFKLKLPATVLVAVCILFALAPITEAQLTTGTIAGTVTIRTDGSALPGVSVEAIHVPTGTRYTAISNANGRYEIPNVRVGGPYRITATLEGFKVFTTENIQVHLGELAEVPLKMQLAAVSEAITVTATT
ncbi:MAG TPA: carboxypeptidase-like regulatory domain-containing protein, partial [Thermoanaerobaculia bacterium]